jgi:hypothetical protein
MYSEFYINKKSGTYSETLEAFGVGNLVSEVLKQSNVQDFKITIKDIEYAYLVKLNKPITQEYLQNLKYYQVIKFLKKEINQLIPDGITDIFDYPRNKAVQDEYKAESIRIEKITSDADKKAARNAFNERKLSEFGVQVDTEYDVYRELIKNPYISYSNLFENFYLHQNNFQDLILSILNYYCGKPLPTLSFNLEDDKPTSQQLFNPNQGKGLNKGKSNNASMSNLKSNWISETMKISGALSYMVCQYVKVGTSYDLKIFVPEFNEAGLKDAKDILFSFKRDIRSSSPIQLDIINSLNFTVRFIRHTQEYTGKVRKTIKGFHTVYQKDLGQNKAVANIAFINTPDFVEYNNQDEAIEWAEILEQQRNLISNIKEQGDSVQGLQAYRNFLGGIGDSALGYFTDFSYWYGNYLMQQLTKGNKFVRTFKTEHLNKFYKNMDTQELNLTEIIQNEGFQAVAKAIRRSTVSLQYTPKDQRQFEIRYGLAQQLQNKSKSKEDLATFIGEFIGTYNAETARNVEKNGGKSFRANVKYEELIEFYSIADKYPARLLGALLSSYGFALTKKDASKDDLSYDNSETSQEDI